MVVRNIIGGKYRLKHKIGEGAMGVVWAAINQQTSREVAVKLIISEDDQLRQRLIREARACGQLSHRNIIEVLDAGATEDRDPFLVMPLLVGETLLDLLKRKRRLDPPVVVKIACDIAKALTAAHAASIVHRDLKPANIFLHREAGSDGAVVKVMDFGICKRLESKDEKLTATGKVIGSPSYMSPEQFVPEKGLDHRTDIWSLGVIMFEMLTGERPFQGDRMKVILSIIDSDIEIPRVSRLVRFVPPALVDIVAGCLVRDREQRIGSAAQLVEMLQAVASSGDTVDGYGEAGRRAAMSSVPEILSRDALEPPDVEDTPEVFPSFPRSLDDSNALTLPRQPGPGRPAARRRPPAPPAPIAKIAKAVPIEPIEPIEEEVEERDVAPEPSTTLDMKLGQPSSSGFTAEDDDAMTEPLSAHHYVSAPSAPVAAAEVAAPAEPLDRGASRRNEAAVASPALHESPAFTFPTMGSHDASSFSGLRPSADSLGAFTRSRWVWRRALAITPRLAILGGAVVVLLLVFSFFAAAIGSQAPEPARQLMPEFTPGALATPAPPAPPPQPTGDLAAPPPSTEQRDVRAAPSSPPKPKLPKTTTGSSRSMALGGPSSGAGKSAPRASAQTSLKCQKKLLKKTC